MESRHMNGKLVLITGASSGIGAETAKKFAAAGAHVLLLARNADRLKQIAKGISDIGGKADEFLVDVGDWKAVKELGDHIQTKIGVPDIVINNAGGGKWRFIEETEYHEAYDMVAAPYLGAFFITKSFMPAFLKRNSGHIVNVTSFAAIIPFSGATCYIAARKAMLGFHEALTADLYGTNIRTSLAYFAKVKSSYWEHNPHSEERLPSSQRMIPVISAERAAQTIVDGVLANKKKITAPIMVRILETSTQIFPCITRSIMNKTGYKRRQEI